jgi:hypothetical protein
VATSTDILTALRDHLVTAGIVRKPNVAGDAPPLVLDPLQGAPGPGELESIVNDRDLIISARPGGDIAPGPTDGWLLQTTIDLIYRGREPTRSPPSTPQIVAQLFLPGGMARPRG